VDVALTVLPEVLDLIGENTIVFEVGSTKTLICKKQSQTIPKEVYRNTSNCGTEFSGPSAAISGLFQGKTNIICGQNRFQITGKSIGSFKAIGMRIRYMEPKSHESILLTCRICLISVHLC
jgi:prephenate dehydrogenase